MLEYTCRARESASWKDVSDVMSQQYTHAAGCVWKAALLSPMCPPTGPGGLP